MNKEKDIILKVENLVQTFTIGEDFLFWKKKRKVNAVNNISFEVERNKTLGLVGESGCGKSTTLRTIMQLYKPTSGRIYFNGKDITKLSKKELLKVKKDMQMVFQDPHTSLNPRMTIKEIIAEPLVIYNENRILPRTKQEIDKRVNELMDITGLEKRMLSRYPHEFSGGQRQRIGIARALALNPKLLLLDEAVSALDVSIRAQILNLLKELQKEFKLSYLFISHDLAVVKYMSDKIAVMYMGVILEIAPRETLFSNPKHPYTKTLIASIPEINPEKINNKTIKLDESSLISIRKTSLTPENAPLEEVEKDHFVSKYLFDEIQSFLDE
ncbi:Oligopeptide transport ATP-binding protein OppF [Borrelia miyamotoi]|uniref:ATP-binding cassette domain-containing protein n=1 Tax=Borrelia miyamotoi TaxID=47466 RepID=A0AAP8YW14_9SPIR|nr:ATP-binding cassette domain-containing protein [Borrelia miyamotoi]AHH05079.1 Oligopeptide transport ATP-binding protein oppF [Borrelia miyamotoi FR64b]ATQ14875.1 ATP-binding cassette domain-containing protein [Borrelia miyamotoi]ATQ16057.1 ATP-binding cassette domain-containing protein [Borrelia miyamotoi]ATQ17203.1 ATP-binding cassette domain-containing protein [Borrelia miyamotoi]ATQ18291.1 ATP-binding cassette domain-containing protein [Borrelia miyamotoi]